MDRRHFMKSSIMAALANPIQAMAKSKTMKIKKGHIAVIGAGAFGGWTAHHLLKKGYDVTLLDVFGPGNSRASSGEIQESLEVSTVKIKYMWIW